MWNFVIEANDSFFFRFFNAIIYRRYLHNLERIMNGPFYLYALL